MDDENADMKTQKLIIFIALILFSLGTYGQDEQIRQTTKSVLNQPEIGVEVAASLGDFLLDRRLISEIDVIYVEEKVSSGGRTVLPGKFYKIRENKKFEYFVPRVSPGDWLIVSSWGKKSLHPLELQVSKKTHMGCISGETEKQCRWIKIKRGKEEQIGTEYFRKTLIYNGHVGNVIRIGYREFIDDRARPAFSNEVQYDLDEGNIIGYGGAQLEVIEATNTNIRYKVIKYFREN